MPFKKGYTPWNKGINLPYEVWNKGLKGIHLSQRTEFKKGHKLSMKKNGIIGQSIDKEGRVRLYINKQQIFRSHINWIRHNQMPIPKGFVVHHRDMDKNNDNINNLLLLPSTLHKQMHGIYQQGGLQ